MLNQNNHGCSFQRKFMGRRIVSRPWKLMTIALAVAVCLLSGLNAAQEKTGEITGTILQEDGYPIPGLLVEATGTNLVGKRTVVTSEKGIFRLLGLPEGSYELVFLLEGFKTVRRRDVHVRGDDARKLDILMVTEEAVGIIVGCQEYAWIDVRKSSDSTDISKEIFLKLPRGRDFTSILAILPSTRPVK